MDATTTSLRMAVCTTVIDLAVSDLALVGAVYHGTRSVPVASCC